MRRSFIPADWVYRADIYDDAAGLVEQNGTYQNPPKTLANGAANAIVGILYDSHNYVEYSERAGLSGQVIGPAGRAEGQRAHVLAYEGIVVVRPSTWALGSNIVTGVRIGVWDQDPVTGGVLTDPSFSLFNTFAGVGLSVETHANTRRWTEERRMYVGFSDASTPPVFTMRFRKRMRKGRRLLPHECFAMYFESNGQAGTVGSVTCTLTCWMRTLVSDET